jgi:hypothetical protein
MSGEGSNGSPKAQLMGATNMPVLRLYQTGCGLLSAGKPGGCDPVLASSLTHKNGFQTEYSWSLFTNLYVECYTYDSSSAGIASQETASMLEIPCLR